MSSSAKTGKALAHRIAVANRAHAISGVLLNIGKLLCTVAVICAVVLANPAGMAAGGAAVAVAISAVVAVCVAAAVAYLAVTGVSIRDLYRSCKQVIQVKEEGLVTVQSLQPVLTPITPIAGKIGCDEIGDAEGAKIAKAQVGGLAVGVVAGAGAIVAQAAAVTLALTGAWPVAAVAGAAIGLAIGGLVALGAAEAYVYKRKTAQKAAKAAALELAKGGLVLGAQGVGGGGAKIAKGGVVTGEVAELVAGALAAPGKEAVETIKAAKGAKNAWWVGGGAQIAAEAGVKALAGNVAQTTSLAAAQTAGAAGLVLGPVAAGGLSAAEAIAKALAAQGGGGAQTAGVVAGALGAVEGVEIVGLLTGAAGVVAGA
ncbi:MAG: hypothetical protein AB8U48_02455, partial [Anaplasma ovis]